MARGFDQHQQRKADVAALGRTLGRRSRSCCELCGDSTSLSVVELPPLPEQPDEDHALMVCERCAAVVGGMAPAGKPDTWRFLAEAVWHETPPVQIAAVRATRQLAAQDVTWATETLDGLFLDPEIEARL